MTSAHQFEFPHSTAPASAELKRWFGWLVLIGPVHMGEQLLSGLDTLYELRALFASYYALFTNPDVGTVLLVIAVVTLVQSMLYGMLAGERGRAFVAGFFGVMGLVEGHHIVHAIVYGRYFPGLITAFAYMAIGAMVLRAAVRVWRISSISARYQLPVAA